MGMVALTDPWSTIVCAAIGECRCVKRTYRSPVIGAKGNMNREFCSALSVKP